MSPCSRLFALAVIIASATPAAAQEADPAPEAEAEVAPDVEATSPVEVAPEGTAEVAPEGTAEGTASVEGEGEAAVEVEPEEIPEITVVGSRIGARTVIDSPVAIDRIDPATLATSSGYLDMNRLLHVVAPSFNATKQSGADGSDHIDPATLRGLGPDQTLVLVNGKRRHQSSLVNLWGSRGRGNTGTDLNAIPVAAIERIEILRDGASAQYGSDAIAGVINIVLKKNTGVVDVWATGGAHQADPPSGFDVRGPGRIDGESVQTSANYGVGLLDGFANLTLDYTYKNGTHREADPAKFTVYRKQFGDAESDSASAWVNSEVPIEGWKAYAFGGASYRRTAAYAWTRDPDSDRNVKAIYPNGFDPLITSDVLDTSVAVGVRRSFGDWSFDLSNTWGRNRFHYVIENTLNASLQERSPTEFDAGGHAFSQNVTGVYAAGPIAGRDDLGLAAGAEVRLDMFSIFAGEEGSWRNYDPNSDPPRPGGSQGFPGFRPENEVNERRTNGAVFTEAQWDVTDALLLEAASRFEHYSDFGGTLNGKLATRFELMKDVALRGSVSTGFRAPSLAQIHYNTTVTDASPDGFVDTVIAKNDSPVTQTLGIPALEEEKSVSGSVGFTAKAGGFRATVDGYYVRIRDRIVLTGAFTDDDPDIGMDLQNLGVGAARFFANALDTETLGLDVVFDGRRSFGDHAFNATLGANFNSMELGEVRVTERLRGKEETFFGRREQAFLIASAPDYKATLSLGHQWKTLSSGVRLTHYAGVELIDYTDMVDEYDPKTVTDVHVAWDATKRFTLVVGGANVFNVYPTQQDQETETGGLWDSVQMGFSGALYYVKLNARL